MNSKHSMFALITFCIIIPVAIIGVLLPLVFQEISLYEAKVECVKTHTFEECVCLFNPGRCGKYLYEKISFGLPKPLTQVEN